MRCSWKRRWRAVRSRSLEQGWGSPGIDGAVAQHYERLFGLPSRRAEFDVRGLPIKVLVWDPGRDREGVYLYATIGASRRPVGDAGSAHRFELFAGSLPDEPKIAGMLSLVAAYPSLFGEPLGHGHSVPFDEPLWPGTAMQMVLLATPVEAIIPRLELPDGSHVEFLQALPAYKSEIEFKAAHGVDQLTVAWQRQAVPFWDPRRPRPRLAEGETKERH
jgi:hypothetical protein